MKRKIYQKMLEWKRVSDGRSALMIDGARRVGKSYIAEEFAKNEYEDYLLIDFTAAPKDVKEYFENYLNDMDVFFMYLLGAYHKELKPRKSVIIFDEVQRFPRAREAIKYLVADGRYDYIETGSLISIRKNVNRILIPSEEHHLKMFPMDFEEFLWAMGCSSMWTIVENAYRTKHPVGDGMHRQIMDLFRQYEVVGGMPQAVVRFAASHDLRAVDAEKRNILDLYRGDIMKFGGVSKHKIMAIFNAIPGLLARHERRFSPGKIKRESGMRDYEIAFEWLQSAMMVNVAYGVTEPNIGLELSSDHSSLKCYLGDTGLLVSMAFSENEEASARAQQRLLTGRIEINRGMITENLVAQLLRAAGAGLYFYSNTDRADGSNTMEIDFLVAKSAIERRHNINPVEVKCSGKYATKSLDKFVSKFNNATGRAYVLHPKDLNDDGDRLYLPLYMTGLLNNH